MESQISNLSDEKLVYEALERVRPDFAALREEELTPVNADIKQMVATIVGALPEIRVYRARIEKELTAFNLAELDKLEDYAWALSYAQTLYLTSTTPAGDLEVLNVEAIRLRDSLLADATSLSKHGLLDGSALGELKGINGYKNVAQDLQILATILKAGWANVEGKTPTQAEDLVTALRISARLTRIVGLREQGPAQIQAAADLRLRAFTLTLRVYEDVRRALGYLRARQGDADRIAPSLFPGKGRARKEEDKTEATEPGAVEATPGAAGAAKAPPATGAAASASGEAAQPAPAKSIGEPFLS